MNNDNQSYDLDLEGVQSLGAVPRRSRLWLLGKRYVPNGGASIDSAAARDRRGSAQKVPEKARLRFCGFMFALEIIESTATL